MKNLLFLFFFCLSFEMFGQPIITTAKVMKFPDDYINKYDPPLNIPPKKGTGVRKNIVKPLPKPPQKQFGLYDSIPSYFLLHELYSSLNKALALKRPDSINLIINFKFDFSFKAPEETIPDNNKNMFLGATNPNIKASGTPTKNLTELKKLRRNNWFIVGSGVGCQVLGIAALTQLKPISIDNRITDAKITSSITGNSSNNLKYGIIGGTLILGGSIMEIVGGININNVNIELNKLTITF